MKRFIITADTGSGKSYQIKVADSILSFLTRTPSNLNNANIMYEKWEFKPLKHGDY